MWNTMQYQCKTTISLKDPQQLLWAHRVDGCSLLSRIEWLNYSTEGISGYQNPTKGKSRDDQPDWPSPTTGLEVSRVCLLARVNDHPESSTSQEQGMNEERAYGKKEDELGLGSKNGRVLDSESSLRRYATELSNDYSNQHTSTISVSRGRH